MIYMISFTHISHIIVMMEQDVQNKPPKILSVYSWCISCGGNDPGHHYSSQYIHHRVSYQATSNAPRHGHSTQQMAYHHSGSYVAGFSTGRLEHSFHSRVQNCSSQQQHHHSNYYQQHSSTHHHMGYLPTFHDRQLSSTIDYLSRIAISTSYMVVLGHLYHSPYDNYYIISIAVVL